MLSFTRKSISLFAKSFTKYFTATHEWIDIQGNVGTVGITDYGAHHLGDVVFADFPTGKDVKVGDELGNIESTKLTSAIFAPMDGKVTEVNPALADNPAIINQSPEKDGWICKISLSNPSATGKLLDADAYKQKLKE
ncbi:putative glycine cleavage system H protein, mitochondrial [Tritrichomonas foetus]|uniref:Glycine cleavage system H protein, mitochondrial n=1 Tax=Tritrichomonas foetus TaxID=1144522 RepID=A0A1J4K282_9EUKA|nr:putative glycine cleavage system H protein, mitochondrial [Tritrichomonas foetus]|eukprot:OHT03846.1 putative glycine cleavage system H protein, mitochondrial [Tritrichomonas foetus]